jgi:hypothetical protein
MFKKIRHWAKNSDTFEVMAIVAIIIGAIIMSSSFYLASMSNVNFKEEFEGISEYVGGLVGSLWSLAGVLLFYASLSSQKEDLERQRELLVRQIDEVVAQTKESRIQNVMFKEQKNEETFFQLLRFHSEIISTITIEQQEVDFVSGENVVKNIEGRKSFVEYYDIYKRFFQEASELTSSHDEDSLSKIFDKAYNSFYLEYQADLGHYFRNLFNLLLFIDSLKKSQQSFYLGLLMAQLSNYELTLLFFHCLRSTNKDFKKLVEQYAILDQVPKDEVTTMAHRLYDSNAFGESGFGSGDIIDDDETGGFDETSLLSSEETDSVLSKFNLPNMDQESESSREKIGTMDDILNKLKKISSEKFPKMNEIDNIDNDDVSFSQESTLDKLREHKKEKIDKKSVKEEDNSGFMLEDFFDDDGESFDYDDDAEVIDIDKIEQIESKGLDNLLKSKLNNKTQNNDLSFESDDKKQAIDNELEDLWGEDSNVTLPEENEEFLAIKNSIGSNLDDDLSILKISNEDQNDDEFDMSKFENIKNMLDSDMDSDDMLFNKDADLLNEIDNENIVDNNDENDDDDDLFDFSGGSEEFDNIKSKFNINFDDNETEEEIIDELEINDGFSLEDFMDDDEDEINNEEKSIDEINNLVEINNDLVQENEFQINDFDEYQNENQSVNDEEIPKPKITLDEELTAVENLNDNFEGLENKVRDFDFGDFESENNENNEIDDKLDFNTEIEPVEIKEKNKEKQNIEINIPSKKIKINVNKNDSEKRKGGSGFLSKLN